MELLVKPEMLTSYIYGPTFGNAETVHSTPLHNNEIISEKIIGKTNGRDYRNLIFGTSSYTDRETGKRP